MYDHCEPFRYGEHTLEGRAQMAGVAIGGEARINEVMWSVRLDDTRFLGFPAYADDNEADVTEKMKHWLDERLSVSAKR